RDSMYQPCRRAPMAESPRSIVIPLATNLHLAFDARLLRTHTLWSGPGLNLRGPPYAGQKSPFLCDFDGTVLWSTPPIFPWSARSAPRKDFQERPPGARFKGISTKGGGVTLRYEFALPGGNTVQVHESPGLRRVGDANVIVRRMEVGACAEETRFLAHVEPGKTPAPLVESFGIVLQRKSDVLLVAARSKATVAWDFSDQPVDYEYDVWAENKLDSEIQRRHVSGSEARFYLRIPAHTDAVALDIFSAVCTAKAEAYQVGQTLARGPSTSADSDFLAGPAKEAI